MQCNTNKQKKFICSHFKSRYIGLLSCKDTCFIQPAQIEIHSAKQKYFHTFATIYYIPKQAFLWKN